MASALAAFAYGLSAAQHKAAAEEDAELVDSEDESPEGGGGGDAPKPNSLVAFAKQHDATTTGFSLVQIAQTQQQQTLATIAAQVSQEEATAAHTRTEKTQSALQAASEHVRAQAQARQRQAVEQAVQQAIAEEQQQYQHDDFEEEDPAIRQAATLLLAKAADADRVGNQSAGAPRSVDRQVLQQRQHRHGLQSRTTASRAATMKDKLSAFQFRQLSLTQRRVFLATLAGDSSARCKPKRCNMDAIHELAKDKAKLQRQKSRGGRTPAFAKLDDARHCRFKPRFATGGGGQQNAKRTSADDSDDDGGNNAAQRSEDFVRRMEAAERAKNEQLRRTREENAYLARVDKKECPMCGNPQSYSELSQKRKKCPNCGVTYKNRIAWSEIADQFLSRMKEYVDARREAKQQPRRRRSDNNAALDGERTWERVQDEFLGRVQLDLLQREVSRAAILRKMQQECSFVPRISSRAKRLDLGSFDERLRRDLEHRKARQEQYKTLAGFIASDAVADAKPRATSGARPAANFQERLRLDLEKRREREQNSTSGQRRQRPEQTRIKW